MRRPASSAIGARSGLSGTSTMILGSRASTTVRPCSVRTTTLHGSSVAIARAARDYGIYVVDTAGFDSFSLAIEWSPNGRVLDQFQRAWGMPFVQVDLSHPWSRDLAMIVAHLTVVTNNRPETPGGGGTPRVPMAPPLSRPR